MLVQLRDSAGLITYWLPLNVDLVLGLECLLVEHVVAGSFRKVNEQLKGLARGGVMFRTIQDRSSWKVLSVRELVRLRSLAQT